MRPLLSTLALALALVLSGCADEFAADTATDGVTMSPMPTMASSTTSCDAIAITGPTSTIVGATETYVVEGASPACGQLVWTVEGDGFVADTGAFSASITAGSSSGSLRVIATLQRASGAPIASDALDVKVVNLPEVYAVSLETDPITSGIELDWSDTFPGCGKPGFRYSVRRVYFDGPQITLDPPFDIPNPATCTTVDRTLSITGDPSDTKIRYLVRTFRDGVRVSTGSSPLVYVEPNSN